MTMYTKEFFVAAARKCLSAGRKRLSVPQSLDLATQVLAVDSGLKPALLYDTNGADAVQVQQYLSSLQTSQLVSKSLLTLDLDGNALIVNPAVARSNVEWMFVNGGVAVVDVSHSLEKPTLTNMHMEELKIIQSGLLLLLSEFGQLTEADKPLDVGEKSGGWNLCTVFGLLLGYPVTYWFDRTESFENCLPMTPLTVTTASATLQENGDGAGGHRCCLYSFSVPTAVLRDTQFNLDNWRISLQERFLQQQALKDLSVSQCTVILPSVCL